MQQENEQGTKSVQNAKPNTQETLATMKGVTLEQRRQIEAALGRSADNIFRLEAEEVGNQPNNK